MFIVYGGVFTDTTFRQLEPGTFESYGPFSSRAEALNKWRGQMGWNIDNCMHRLFITEYDERVTGLPTELCRPVA